MKRHIFITLCLIGAFCCPLSRPLFALAADDERQVVATGVGMTEDDAKRQAYRNAIQSVIGTMVVAETLVEKDALVQDKVLSHSDGYITKAAQIGGTTVLEGSLVQVTMRVTVKSQQLQEKLQGENLISVAQMDGSQILLEQTAKKETKEEATKKAAAIVAEAIKGLPASVISATANIGQAVVKESGESSTITVPITVTANTEAYRKFTRGLKETLTKLGFTGETVSVPVEQLYVVGGNFPLLAAKLSQDLQRTIWSKATQESPDCIIAICEAFSEDQSRLTFFKVTKEVLDAFKAVPNYVQIKAELYDGGDSLITSQNVILKSHPKESNVNELDRRDVVTAVYQGGLLVSPGLRIPSTVYNHGYFFIGRKGYVPATQEASFVLANDEIKAVKSIRTSVHNSELATK